ncbi:MAG TPA: dihydrolipoamide dehydrogenase [Flavobacterium sp.]|nr:dihydrolipoamide dehydrogenase [Flavobacterium sp.]HAT77017.1 dihydrolipoamide dehydrogenase [Flavobacterium sp.]
MKKIIFILAMIIANYVSEAQVKTPQPSPKSTLTQVVGLTTVEIVYSRPSAKGRDVFNNLVPFGKLWRTGANENTTISFSDDVIIDGKTLAKGKYAIFTTPKADIWEIIFYTATDNWGNPENWDEAKVALKTTAKSDHIDRFVESFTIGINNLDNNFAHLELSWEKTIVALKFEVPTAKNAIASIDKVLAGPGAGDYFSAAQYYFQSNGDMTKALTYVNKALDMNKDKPFWYNRLKSLIQAKLGDKNGAIETAKISLASAEVAKNQDYVKMNKDSIAEWSKK